MANLISTAILIAALFGGTYVASRIHHAIRETAQGMPKLARFTASLTKTAIPKGE